MLRKLLNIRFVFLVAVVFTLLNALCFLILGVREAIHGYQALYASFSDGSVKNIGILFLDSLDMFLIAMVFLIFGLGIVKIFVHYHSDDKMNLPAWLHIQEFKELKILLWEAIIVTLVVFGLGRMVENRDPYNWGSLILPLIILILSISLYFTRQEPNKKIDK
jgi:uncharacterized membrane protein YqhA